LFNIPHTPVAAKHGQIQFLAWMCGPARKTKTSFKRKKDYNNNNNNNNNNSIILSLRRYDANIGLG